MSRIITPFGFVSTAAEVVAGVDLSGKRCIVTGGASGIGIETARALAASGAAVTYGQSKTATALLAVGVTHRWANQGIFGNAVNPGAIATGLQKYTGGLKTPVERRKTPEQGAATSVLAAASPLLDGIGARYFEDCSEARPVARRPTDFSGGVAPYAVDADNAERLWDVALKAIQ